MRANPSSKRTGLQLASSASSQPVMSDGSCMLKLLPRFLIAMLILAFLPIGYVLSGPYLDRRAIRQANEFCSLVSVGETVGSLKSKSEKVSVSLEEWPPRPGGEERFMVRFSGFLANAVYCEISVSQKKVEAKFVEKEFW